MEGQEEGPRDYQYLRHEFRENLAVFGKAADGVLGEDEPVDEDVELAAPPGWLLPPRQS